MIDKAVQGCELCAPRRDRYAADCALSANQKRGTVRIGPSYIHASKAETCGLLQARLSAARCIYKAGISIRRKKRLEVAIL